MNVLLNLYNFDAPWARPLLEKVLRPHMRALILPLSFHDDWVTNEEDWRLAYAPGGEYYEELVAPFRAYGIQEEAIGWVDYFTDTPDSACAKLKAADVIFFTGGLPDRMMARLRELELVKPLRRWNGVVMGASAGAMIQFGIYHITPDDDYPDFRYEAGLGYLEGFEMEVHYMGTDVQNESAARVIAERFIPVYEVGNEGGLFIDDAGTITPMGDVARYDENDLYPE